MKERVDLRVERILILVWVLTQPHKDPPCGPIDGVTRRPVEHKDDRVVLLGEKLLETTVENVKTKIFREKVARPRIDSRTRGDHITRTRRDQKSREKDPRCTAGGPRLISRQCRNPTGKETIQPRH